MGVVTPRTDRVTTREIPCALANPRPVQNAPDLSKGPLLRTGVETTSCVAGVYVLMMCLQLLLGSARRLVHDNEV